MSGEPVEPDAVLSGEEMRRATGLGDLEMLSGLRAASAPVGYNLAERDDAETVLFRTSGQDFLVWCQPFLTALAKRGTVRLACAEAGITRREYRLALQWQHGFEEAVQDALDEYADRLDEQALAVVAPWGRHTDKDGNPTGEEVMFPPFEKAYALLWKVMQGRMPEKYGRGGASRSKALSGDQKRFLIEAIVREGFSRAEAESMVDLGASAMALAEGR
jgi:hypothetical protein